MGTSLTKFQAMDNRQLAENIGKYGGDYKPVTTYIRKWPRLSGKILLKTWKDHETGTKELRKLLTDIYRDADNIGQRISNKHCIERIIHSWNRLHNNDNTSGNDNDNNSNDVVVDLTKSFTPVKVEEERSPPAAAEVAAADKEISSRTAPDEQRSKPENNKNSDDETTPVAPEESRRDQTTEEETSPEEEKSWAASIPSPSRREEPPSPSPLPPHQAEQQRRHPTVPSPRREEPMSPSPPSEQRQEVLSSPREEPSQAAVPSPPRERSPPLKEVSQTVVPFQQREVRRLPTPPPLLPPPQRERSTELFTNKLHADLERLGHKQMERAAKLQKDIEQQLHEQLEQNLNVLRQTTQLQIRKTLDQELGDIRHEHFRIVAQLKREVAQLVQARQGQLDTVQAENAKMTSHIMALTSDNVSLRCMYEQAQKKAKLSALKATELENSKKQVESQLEKLHVKLDTISKESDAVCQHLVGQWRSNHHHDANKPAAAMANYPSPSSSAKQSSRSNGKGNSNKASTMPYATNALASNTQQQSRFIDRNDGQHRMRHHDDDEKIQYRIGAARSRDDSSTDNVRDATNNKDPKRRRVSAEEDCKAASLAVQKEFMNSPEDSSELPPPPPPPPQLSAPEAPYQRHHHPYQPSYHHHHNSHPSWKPDVAAAAAAAAPPTGANNNVPLSTAPGWPGAGTTPAPPPPMVEIPRPGSGFEHYRPPDDRQKQLATKSKRRCVPLSPSQTMGIVWGNDHPLADYILPHFHELVNFPTNKPHNRQHEACTMCGQVRMICTKTNTAARHSRRPSPKNYDNYIPHQNKGVCNICDVAVFKHVESGVEIKWCKGCKNFRPWAAFGDRTSGRKCMKCRTKNKTRYQKAKVAKQAAAATAKETE